MTPKSTIDQNSFVPWAEFLVRDNLPSLVLICLAVWLHAVDSMIVATMLPSIVADIGGESLVSWSISLYEIASVVAGAASALLTMRFGLRLPLSLAAALFGVGCFISAGSPTMALFLIGRCLQGLGGGGLVAMAFVSVGALFARRYTARALAVLSAFWGIAAFLGPLIGGLFVGFSTWRWGYVFFGGQAVGLALWILIRPEQSASISTEAMTFPMRRLALLCIAVLLISIGGIDVSALKTSLFVIAGLICIAAFLHLDGQAGPNRLLPLQPFSLQNATGAALLMIMSLAVATVALTAFGPLLMTVIHGISALTAGYLVACSSIGWTIAAVVVSGSPEKFDRLFIAMGIILVVLSIGGFLYAIPQGPVWLIAVFATLEGGGFGLAWTFILRRVTTLANPDEAQRIAGAMPTVQRLGYALGAAYIGIIANASGFAAADTAATMAPVANAVFLACFPFAALALVSMVRFVRSN